MKSILVTLKEKGYPVTNEDEEIYAEFLDVYKYFSAYTILFANLSILLNKKEIVDELLGDLEEEVKKLWEEEAQTESSVLELHEPKQYIFHWGLPWPFPTPELASNRGHHLLSRVLLKTEQRHGINMPRDGKVSIPTLVGYAAKEATRAILSQDQLWNEESKLSGLFYHGKMTHRIQIHLIMKAIERGLLDIAGLSITDLIKLLCEKKDERQVLAWDLLIDNVNVLENITTCNAHPEPLTKRYKAKISLTENQDNYIFGCDAYYFHSYLMVTSRNRTPYLSECVSQIFCKSAFAIQRLERSLGYQYKYNDFVYFYVNDPRRESYCIPLTKEDYSMESVLYRQALTFATGGGHALQSHHIVEDQIAREKISAIEKEEIKFRPLLPTLVNKTQFTLFSSCGIVQYRAIHQANPKKNKQAVLGEGLDDRFKRQRV